MTSSSRRFRRPLALGVAVAACLLPLASAAGDDPEEIAKERLHLHEAERPEEKDAQQAQFATQHGLLGAHASAARLEANAAADAIPVLPATGAWREAGPKPYHTDDPKYGLDIEGFTVVAGRNPALAVDPTNPDIVWA